MPQQLAMLYVQSCLCFDLQGYPSNLSSGAQSAGLDGRGAGIGRGGVPVVPGYDNAGQGNGGGAQFAQKFAPGNASGFQGGMRAGPSSGAGELGYYCQAWVSCSSLFCKLQKRMCLSAAKTTIASRLLCCTQQEALLTLSVALCAYLCTRQMHCCCCL